MPWYVLYTKSRNEKIVAEKLRERGINVYCPIIKTKRKWSDRNKLVEEPLFRSYCFVNLQEKERANVFGIPGIVRYLFWQNKPAVVRDFEIEAIRTMLSEVDHSLIRIETFLPEDTVKIKSGIFDGTEGKVLNQQGNTVSLFVKSLQIVLKIDVSKSVVSI